MKSKDFPEGQLYEGEEGGSWGSNVGRRLILSAWILLSSMAASPVVFAEVQNVLCNKTVTDYYYATLHEDIDGISLRCELQRQNCQVKVEGWFRLKPGDCNALPIGTAWTTYLAIMYTGKDGEPHAPR